MAGGVTDETDGYNDSTSGSPFSSFLVASIYLNVLLVFRTSNTEYHLSR